MEGFLPDDITHSLQLAPFNQFKIDGELKTYETNVIWNKVYKTQLFKDSNIQFDMKARKGQDVILNAEIMQIARRFYYMHETLYHYRYIRESIYGA